MIKKKDLLYKIEHLENYIKNVDFEQEKQKVRDLEIQKEICEKQLVFICSQIDINKAFTETLKNINEQLLSIKKERKL